MEHGNFIFMDSKKLKICQICAVDFTLKHFLMPLIKKLEENYDVTTICTKGDYINEFIKDGHKYKEIKIFRNLNIFLHIQSVLNLRKIISKEKFDIIHCHSPIASLITRIACLFLKKRVIIIYSAHGFYFHDEMNFFLKYFHILLEKILSFNTNYIFTQSHEDYLSAIKYKFINKKNIFHISNGVNIEKFLNNDLEVKKNSIKFKKTNQINYNNIIIGFIGRLSKEKGFEEYLDTAEFLLKKYNNLTFLVIGDFQHGKKSKNIFEKLNHLNKKQNFIYLGYQENIPMYLNIINIFCLPSYREGMPRSIIEAMVAGKAIIATNIRGCREEIINNKTGLLIPSKNSNSLIISLEKLINNKNLTEYLAKNAREYAIKNFDEKNVIEKQKNIIDSILKI